MNNEEALFKFITKDESILDLLKAGQENLSVYKSSYLQNILSALENKFTATRAYLKQENFNYFSYQYFKVTHSKSSNLDEYGQDFPSFLYQRDELKEHATIVKDIASIDLMWFQSNLNYVLKASKGALKNWNSLIRNENILFKESLEKEEFFFAKDKKNIYLLSR